MKGFSAAIEFVARILISVLVIGVMIILLTTFLPQVFQENYCRSAQLESINSLIEDATGASAITIRTFRVEKCVEFLDFRPIKCVSDVTRGEDRYGSSPNPSYHRCYEFMPLGQLRGNCEELRLTCHGICENKDECENDCGGEKGCIQCEGLPDCKICVADCSNRKGTINILPGGYDNYEINSPGGLKLETGTYTVEIGPYKVNFLRNQN